MPVSKPDTIPNICRYIMARKPKSILDIGIGFGLWGFLSRNYGVIWDSELTQEKYDDWRYEIIVDGIEISESLITDLQRMLYNKIFIGDASEIAPKLKDYDLYIMSDVIEHLDKKTAIKLIKQLRKKGKIIITTPDYWNKGKAILGNEYEKHKCFLKDEDFPYEPIIVHVDKQKVVIYE